MTNRRGNRETVWGVFAVAAACAWIATGAAVEQPAKPPREDKVSAKVAKVLAAVRTATIDEAWAAVETLREFGKEAVAPLTDALDAAAPHQKLVIARVLAEFGEAKKASEVFTFLLADKSVPAGVKVAACRVVSLTPQLFSREELVDHMRRNLYAEDPALKIGAADALLRHGKPSEAVRTLMQVSTRKDAYGEEAALVLAENGYLAWVAKQLEQIQDKPTENGRRAFLLLKSADVVLPGYSLLKEVYETVQNYYVDAKTLDVEEVITATARGMVSALDPFSSYLNEQDVKDMQESIEGRYGGIGAYVGMHNGIFTIISPIYDGPAYRVGIRSMDQVLKVGGKDTAKMRFMEVVKNLKGPPGTKVEVRVARAGWAEARDFTITREEITIDSVLSAMLPGGIGYLRLTRFGDTTTGECIKAVEELKKRGAKVYILDLRDNGGGLLNEAVGVGDLFLEAGKLIVYSEGRPGVSDRREYRARGGSLIGNVPLVVLINNGSASASEIVAGAIQDLKRGVLVGEKTYGKGSVQTVFDLSSTLFRTKLRLTIAKYYLPSGRCIHESGVEPDIKVKPQEMAPWKIDALLALEDKVEAFVADFVEKHKDIVQALAEFDNRDVGRYPGLDAFIKSINDPRLNADDIRRYVRGVMRRRAADLRGKAHVADVEEDVVLRRGVLEALRLAGIKDYPAEYAGLAEEFAKADKEKADAVLEAAKTGAEERESVPAGAAR